MPLGQVFTPPALAGEVLAAVPAAPGRILDPACGDGNFLAAAARRWPEADLFGFEADPALAAAARRRIPGARIETCDALEAPLAPDFDLVAGNPPYAAAFRATAGRSRLRGDHRLARGSFDLAVPFVERAVGWLRPGGWLALVVTNKLLVKDYAARLRSWLLDEVAIAEIWDLAAAPAFPGVAIDVAVLVARRGPAGPTRIVLARKDGSRESFEADPRRLGTRGRWEVYRTPAVAGMVSEIEECPRLGEVPDVRIRDGILGRSYHTVAIHEGGAGCPVVPVGRVGPGVMRWETPLRRAGMAFADPRMRVEGAFAAFCLEPKVLVRGVARQLVAAFCPEPAVPMVAVRAIAGYPEPHGLVAWLNDPLASFYLQVTCRGDRIPNGSYNISKAWLQALPLAPGRALDRAARAWLEDFGI